MADETEYLTPDEYGALTRADHAVKASQEHFQYLVSRLFAQHHLRPGIDFIEPDGHITRADP